MTTAIEIDTLQRRLAELDKALAENEVRLRASPPHAAGFRNFHRQELESEALDLRADREMTEDRLRKARAALQSDWSWFRRRKPDPAVVARDQLVDRLVREARENVEAFAARLEREGDHRQARIWRGTIPDIRARVLRELGIRS